jgi:hypothetical protein
LQKGGNTASLERLRMLVELLILLNLILGIVFGFIHRGKEDYFALLWNGALAGLLLGIIFVLAANYLLPGGMSIDIGIPGVLGIFGEIFIFFIIFLLGAFIGDKLEGIRKK